VATPLNPLLTKQQLVERLLRRFPTLTREELCEEAQAYGFDLTEDELPPSSKRGAPTISE
jgi:hypothetical protein